MWSRTPHSAVLAQYLGPDTHPPVNIRDIDWARVSAETLRALRGHRSQLAFSRRLGYRGRPVADWEAGRRFPTAARFFHACRIAKVDVRAAAARFHPSAAPSLGAGDEDTQVAAWLKELAASTPITALAQRSGLPRFSVSRFLSGQSRPRLPQFFALLEAATGRAADLVAELVSIHDVPSLSAAYEQRWAAKRLAFEVPWSSAVLRVIETEAYRSLSHHPTGVIAATLGISAEMEVECIEGLERAGMVEVDPRTGKLHAVPTTVDTHASPEDMRRLKSHWAEVAARRIRVAGPDELFSFNVVSASSADLETIHQLLRATFREIRSLIAASSPVQEVALIQLQLAKFGPLTPEPPTEETPPGS